MPEMIVGMIVVFTILFIVCRTIYAIVRCFDRREINRLMGESLSKRAGNFLSERKD
jgi:Na+-transporting methylmalonyl-CoA/oxaloacetate decarboxylase gamma subunit